MMYLDSKLMQKVDDKKKKKKIYFQKIIKNKN